MMDAERFRFDRKRLAASWTSGAAIVRGWEDRAAGLGRLALVSKFTGLARSMLNRSEALPARRIRCKVGGREQRIISILRVAAVPCSIAPTISPPSQSRVQPSYLCPRLCNTAYDGRAARLDRLTLRTVRARLWQLRAGTAITSYTLLPIKFISEE
jgi:hypothetical protein